MRIHHLWLVIEKILPGSWRYLLLHCCIWKSKEEAHNAMKQCRFQIILKSKYNKVVQSLACSVEPTSFCPMCRSTAFFFSFFIEDSRALTALILPSIPACYPDVTLDSPHGGDLIKTCQNIWEVGLPGMQLAKRCQSTKEQESSQKLLWRHLTNLTAFSITHQWASKAFDLADVQWEKVNVAQPAMTLSVFKWDQSPQTTPVWAGTQQYLTISGVLVWDRMDILTFNAGYK